MEKKVAIVTGAAGGIGLAIAARLGRNGYHVVVLDVLTDDTIRAADGLRVQGIEVTPLVMDLAQSEQVRALPESLGALFPRVGVLVNNAGISLKRDGRRIPVEEISLEDWERIIRINLTAPFLLSQMVLAPMRKQGWGRIVNISSKAGRTPSGVPGVDYVATKTGLLGLSRGIAKEVAGEGITVNSVAPGRIQTPMGENVDDVTRTKILAAIPVNRMGTPEEIAALVGFLASADAGFITGAVIDINGGALMI
jgi:3-oxoacyl-[acyl-carrier protein] reductase